VRSPPSKSVKPVGKATRKKTAEKSKGKESKKKSVKQNGGRESSEEWKNMGTRRDGRIRGLLCIRQCPSNLEEDD